MKITQGTGNCCRNGSWILWQQVFKPIRLSGGEIFVRVAEQISNEDRLLFQAVARAIIPDARGSLHAQISTRRTVETEIPHVRIRRAGRGEHIQRDELPPRDLIYFNGLGG